MLFLTHWKGKEGTATTFRWKGTPKCVGSRIRGEILRNQAAGDVEMFWSKLFFSE